VVDPSTTLVETLRVLEMLARGLRTVGLALLCLAALSFCGGESLCEHQDAATRALLERAASCSNASFHFSSRAACQQAITSCSTSDYQLILRWLNCVDGVASCSPGGESIFYGTINLCSTLLEGLSGPCRNAGFTGISR